MLMTIRKLLVRALFLAWTKVAGIKFIDESECDFELPEFDFAGVRERFEVATQGRALEVWIPLSLERRMKAHIHRMNAAILVAGCELEAFDIEANLSDVLMASANLGMRVYEDDDGVRYDEFTGLCIDDLVAREES